MSHTLRISGNYLDTTVSLPYAIMNMSDGRCDICGGEDAEYIEVDDHCEY